MKVKRFLGLVRRRSGLERTLAEELGYRKAMPVTEIFMLLDSEYGWTGFAACPRCRTSMEREYVSFCDRCGQRLDWIHYSDAEVVFPEKQHQ